MKWTAMKSAANGIAKTPTQIKKVTQISQISQILLALQVMVTQKAQKSQKVVASDKSRRHLLPKEGKISLIVIRIALNNPKDYKFL